MWSFDEFDDDDSSGGGGASDPGETGVVDDDDSIVVVVVVVDDLFSVAVLDYTPHCNIHTDCETSEEEEKRVVPISDFKILQM